MLSARSCHGDVWTVERGLRGRIAFQGLGLQLAGDKGSAQVTWIHRVTTGGCGVGKDKNDHSVEDDKQTGKTGKDIDPDKYEDDK